MNKKRNVTNAVIVFDKNVKVSELEHIGKDFNGDIVINKKLIIDKEIELLGNLHVIGGIKRKSPIAEYAIYLNGNLYCYDEIHAQNINIDGSLFSESYIYAKNITVEGDFTCYAKTECFGYDVIVSGDIESYDVIKAERVLALNRITAHAPIAAKFIKSGY